MGVELFATLTGSYHLASRPDCERALSLSIRAEAPSAWRLLRERKLALSGSAYLEGLVPHRAARGEARFGGQSDAFYSLTFHDDEGRGYLLEANPVERAGGDRGARTLEAKLADELGAPLGIARLRFDGASPLRTVLGTLRFV